MIADPKRVMLLGDVHGSHNWTIHAIKRAADNGADVIGIGGQDGPQRGRVMVARRNAEAGRC